MNGMKLCAFSSALKPHRTSDVISINEREPLESKRSCLLHQDLWQTGAVEQGIGRASVEFDVRLGYIRL